MNTLPLSRPLTLDEFMKGYADGGEVESIMPTEDDNFLSTLPADVLTNLANRYDVTTSDFNYYNPEAGQKAMALASLIDPTLLKGFGVGDAAFGGAGTSGTAIADYYRAVAPETVGGQGSLYEEGAIEAAKRAAADPTQGLFKSGFEALAGQPGIEEAIKSKSERDLSELAKVESDFEVMKPISDLLKANKFKEAFEVADEKGVVDKMMSPGWLQQLRQPFTAEEMKAFYNAIPPDYRGSDFKFDPNRGQVSESGYPEPLSAFKYEQPLTAIDAIIRLGGAAVLGAGALSALGGAGAAGAGAAGAGGTGAGVAGTAGAGAAGTSGGVLSGLKAAATKILGIPEVIGTKVGEALGASTLNSLQAKMIGNAIISGGVTGAKGGDLEDILKSAALAAGLTYVSDKAIKAVTGSLGKSGVIDAVSEIPGGDVTAVDPSVASNVADKITQNLDKVTVIGSKALDLAQQVGGAGALTAAQAATRPGASKQQVAPEDEIAAEYSQIYERPVSDFGAGLETGAYTGYRLASDQGVGAEQPATTPEETAAAEQPGAEREFKIATEGDKLALSDVTSPLAIAGGVAGAREPFVPQKTVDGMQQFEQVAPRRDITDLISDLPKISQVYSDQTGYKRPYFEETPTDEIVVQANRLKPIDIQPDIANIANIIPALSQQYKDLYKYEKPITEDTSLDEVVVTGSKLPPLDLTGAAVAIPALSQQFTKEPFEVTKETVPEEKSMSDRFKSLLDKYGTVENLLKVAGAVSGLGSTKTPPTTGAGAVYDPRTGAGTGAWIDWEKVKAEADAAGMNLNTYTARNWNKIQNRALEAGAPRAVAPVTPQGYNFPGLGGENMMVSPEAAEPNFDLLKYLEEYQPQPLAKGSKVNGPGHGREDLIPALLSDGEYVIDAETMALLGNGSTDAAAKMMDKFRENVRKHKGATLAKGGISPDAKSPLHYLRGA